MERTTVRTRGAAWTVAAFFMALWTPLLTSLLEPDSTLSRTEKRRLASLPEIGPSLADLGSFPARMNAYLDDHMGFRDWLIRKRLFRIRCRPNDRSCR